jgi:hypothetical protein
MGAAPADGFFTLTYGVKATSTPPLASETIDASKYGM